MTRTPQFWFAVAIAALVLAIAAQHGCARPESAAPNAAAPTATVTPDEERAAVSASRAADAADVLLGRATVAGLRADSLSALLRLERLRSAPLYAALASSRAATDRALDSVRVDTVRVAARAPEWEPPRLPDLLAERIVVERAASDRALDQCETRATLSDSVAEAQASRATWAYAAADSAFAALSYTRLAYVEADARAARSTRLASRRGRLLTVGAGLLVGACAVAILR